MWKIKDPELKRKMNQFISDEGINQLCKKQMEGISKCIFFFEEFPEYNPDGWNPFPEVNPPECGEYLVTFKDEDEDYVQQNYFDMQGRWGTAHSDVIAFRALPAPYQPEENK